MLQTVEAIVEPTGAVRLLEALHVDHPCRAFVTLLERPDSEKPSPGTSAATALAFLSSAPLPVSARLSAREIDAQIEAERQSWD